MGQYKFSCPACGQHFSGDFGYCGLEMTCPNCQGQFTVPNPGSSAPLASASNARPRRTTVSLPAKLPVLPPGRETQAAPPARTSGLAVASLVCSAGSFIFIPFGFIPGIICAYAARKRLAQNPELRGRGFAKAGLILGYISLALYLIALLVLVVFGMSLAKSLRK
jgi:hypothetical protein